MAGEIDSEFCFICSLHCNCCIGDAFWLLFAGASLALHKLTFKVT